MLRFLASGAMIGGIWMAYASPGAAPVETVADAIVEHQPALEWRVSGRDPSGKPCTIRLASAGVERTYAMDTDPACREVVENLSRARVWREDERGFVKIEDEAGATLVEFGPAEFDGMVSVYPRHMDLALLPAD